MLNNCVLIMVLKLDTQSLQVIESSNAFLSSSQDSLRNWDMSYFLWIKEFFNVDAHDIVQGTSRSEVDSGRKGDCIQRYVQLFFSFGK